MKRALVCAQKAAASVVVLYLCDTRHTNRPGAVLATVDAQSMVALESAHAVVPPTETLVRLQEFAVHLTESEMQKSPAR
jgi:hypothetical protein